jgi:hypothetical protein
MVKLAVAWLGMWVVRLGRRQWFASQMSRIPFHALQISYYLFGSTRRRRNGCLGEEAQRSEERRVNIGGHQTKLMKASERERCGALALHFTRRAPTLT